MIVVTFRNRLAPGIDEQAYMQRSAKLYQIVSGLPGFLSFHAYTAEDGERLALVEFEDEESLAVWRKQSDHVAAQQEGRRSYYSDYTLQVCQVLRDSRFVRSQSAASD